jgi:hypothetical protein
MNDPEFENLLRGMKPASPSMSLEGRIAASLPENASKPRATWLGWFTERLVWAAAGAAAVWLTLLVITPPQRTPRTAAQPEVAASQPQIPRVSEERLPWADEGVQFIGGQTPARLLRRTVVERHFSPDGSTEVRVPREDVILLPVSLR